MNEAKLFVYGTLKSGCENVFARLLRRNACLAGRARMPGKLYRVAHYPGMLPSEDPADWVRGEVFIMRHPRPLLKRLDAYEGPAFERVTCTASLDNGEQTTAWVYLYRGPVDPQQRIESGEFEI